MESLYETALNNTAAQAPARINSMMSVFFDGEEPLELEEVFREEGLYILSNPQKDYGAATMLYPGLLQSIAESTQSGFISCQAVSMRCCLSKRTMVWTQRNYRA